MSPTAQSSIQIYQRERLQEDIPLEDQYEDESHLIQFKEEENGNVWTLVPNNTNLAV
jgi:hypothetical protein